MPIFNANKAFTLNNATMANLYDTILKQKESIIVWS